MRKFFNPNTVYDPDYRNVQSELWTLLSDEQRAVVGGVFKHLKNHSQIEIAEAHIDYVEEDIRPDIRDWSDILNAILFNYILFRAFGINITAEMEKPREPQPIGKLVSNFLKGFRK